MIKKALYWIILGVSSLSTLVVADSQGYGGEGTGDSCLNISGSTVLFFATRVNVDTANTATVACRGSYDAGLSQKKTVAAIHVVNDSSHGNIRCRARRAENDGDVALSSWQSASGTGFQTINIDEAYGSGGLQSEGGSEILCELPRSSGAGHAWLVAYDVSE